MKSCLVRVFAIWICVSVVVALNITTPDVEYRFGESDDNNETKYEMERLQLRARIRGIELPHLFRVAVKKIKSFVGSVAVCSLCITVTKSLIIQRRFGATRQQLLNQITTICTTFKIEEERVCRGTIDLNIDSFLYAVDHMKYFLPSVRICGMIFQNYNCPLGIFYNAWTISVPSGSTVQKIGTNKDGISFNILHISDMHYDSRYTPGANADCGEPMCCQDDQPAGDDASKKCGYWTDYVDADTPWHLVTEVMRQVNTHYHPYLYQPAGNDASKKCGFRTDYIDADIPWHLVTEVMRQVNTHDLRYVYYTGDIISHRVWDTSIAKNTEDVTKLFKEFQKNFTVPVYPCLGNHEPSPLNLFAHEYITDKNLTTKWLYDLSAELWSPWLPEEALATIRKGGYYTATPEKGFRIISLNSNVCYSYNWWNILDDKDQYDQLQWMSDVLANAERNGERVHILSHIPSGDASCLKTWSKAYVKILRRFANTIVGQFVGHTHHDEFQVYYKGSSKNSKPIGVAFNGASITAYTNTNPSYKVFKVEESTFGLQDYEEWTFNVTEANERPDDQINWYSLYKFTEAYGVDTLDPSEVGALVERMWSDSELTEKYFKYKYRNADPSIEKGCDRECDRENLCSIVTTVFGDTSKCR